jgi:hypothetical protein
VGSDFSAGIWKRALAVDVTADRQPFCTSDEQSYWMQTIVSSILLQSIRKRRGSVSFGIHSR